MNLILEKVKLSLRIMTDDFDDEIIDLINACLDDLGIAGITSEDTTNPLIIRAIQTYCKLNFGDIEGVEMLEKIKKSYDEQKAQLSMNSNYTDWLK